MNTFTLVWRNLGYHWRGNLAVALGVALATAVLTGALLVGDSLRGSLRALALGQLAWVEEAIVPGRLFRAALADQLDAERVAPAFMLQGSTSREGVAVGRVSILGVDERFGLADGPLWRSDRAEAFLSSALAQALGARPGDTIALHFQKTENIPRESLLGRRDFDDVADKVSVKVAAIADDSVGNFRLKPSPEAVRNVFVPLAFLQRRLDQAGRANALMVAGPRKPLEQQLKAHLTLDDWGARLRTPEQRADALLRFLDPRGSDEIGLKKVRWSGRVPDDLADAARANGNLLTRGKIVDYYQKQHPYLSLESRQMFLDPAVARAAEPTASRRLFVYLADTLRVGKAEVPYAIVAGTDGLDLKDGEIALATWPGSPFDAKVGDRLDMSYFSPDAHNHLQKLEKQWTIARILPIEGWADDPDLTPEFPGITDKLDMASWDNPPFPYESKRIRPGDEEYWKRYRTTPRAYVNLKTAQHLWGGRFGNLTSLHFGAGAAGEVEAKLLAGLQPSQGGFAAQPVRELALRASAGSNDFGVLFLAFSFFLIAAALLLVGLLFRLNLDRRAAELGVLVASGWTPRQTQGLLLLEGLALALAGSLAGLAGGWLYAPAMLAYLRANWPEGAGLGFLQLYASPLSLAIGAAASLAISALTIYWSTRVLAGLAPRALLAGESTESAASAKTSSGPPVSALAFCLLCALALLLGGARAQDHEARAGSFFGSGALLLSACLMLVAGWLRRLARQHAPQPNLTALGVRNAARQPTRSLLTVGLLAAATFVVVAVESFHRGGDAHFFERDGGSGGFALFAESDTSFYQDLNAPSVRADLGLDDPGLEGVRFVACRRRGGDDASCLNLYQPLQPRIVGVPQALIDRGGFRFASGMQEHPWQSLNERTGDEIPVLLDANTAQWVLKVPVGGTFTVQDGNAAPRRLRVAALLQESIFQSEILMSEESFLELFPREEGYQLALIDTGRADPASVIRLLSPKLQPLGLTVESTAARVRSFQEVENTYLATFQLLGGLGLLLGAVGLAIVLLRGVWERRSEFALLQALGFRAESLAWLVLAENSALLLLGLAAGTLSALLAVGPHLAARGAEVLWLRMLGLLLAVSLVGMLSSLAAVWATVRAPVLQALRRE